LARVYVRRGSPDPAAFGAGLLTPPPRRSREGGNPASNSLTPESDIGIARLLPAVPGNQAVELNSWADRAAERREFHCHSTRQARDLREYSGGNGTAILMQNRIVKGTIIHRRDTIPANPFFKFRRHSPRALAEKLPNFKVLIDPGFEEGLESTRHPANKLHCANLFFDRFVA
jgi:hypothetical protein